MFQIPIGIVVFGPPIYCSQWRKFRNQDEKLVDPNGIRLPPQKVRWLGYQKYPPLQYEGLTTDFNSAKFHIKSSSYPSGNLDYSASVMVCNDSHDIETKSVDCKVKEIPHEFPLSFS